MAEKARMIDVSKCIGCRACQVACKHWNQLPAAQTEFTGSYENPPDLLPETWSRIMFREHENGDEVKWHFCFNSCMHCEDPACLPVCPVDAIFKTELASVNIDQETCIACGLCVTACPFDIPRIAGPLAEVNDVEFEQPEEAIQVGMKNASWKCTFCYDRISNGLSTACAKACPTGTITFGDQEEKLQEAENRVADLQDLGYGNPQIYGKEEVGGTHVYYVLEDDPDTYGLPADPQVSLTTYFWNVALRPVKTLAAIGLAVGFMNNFINKKAEEKNTKGQKEMVE